MKKLADTNKGPDARGGFESAASITDQLSALSDELRLRLLRLLEVEDLSVGEVAKVVQMPQSTISRHLKVLNESGWLSRRTEGTASFYRLLLDDLPIRSRSLWLVVREQLQDGPRVAEDLRRLQAVLADRRTDSLSYFGRISGEWDAIRGELFGSSFTASALPALLPGSWVVADLGCGTGNVSELVAPFVARVLAVDQSDPMLEAARKRLETCENVEFLAGDLTALPIEDGAVDAAICVLVLHHLPDPGAAVRELARILRPGGKALIVDMVSHDRADYRNSMGHQHLGFKSGQIEDLLADAGLARARVINLPCDPEGKGPGLFAATAIAPSS